MKFDVKDLQDKGLIRIKEQDGLKIIKYHNKVFYDNLWDEDLRLPYCRGMVVDKDWNIVSHPFKKVFNYLENGVAVHPAYNVDLIRKVNGFMLTVSLYNGSLLYSTTGSLDSDYVKLGKKVLEASCHDLDKLFSDDCSDNSYMFEICCEEDPHIVTEETGAYLIGACKKFHLANMPCLYGEGFLDKKAAEIGAKRPEVREDVLFSDALDMLKDVQHEGFMVRCSRTGSVLCKLKSPYYLTKKFFMRVSNKRLERVFENKNEVKKTIDEEYYPLLDFITSNYTKEQWSLLQEQERKFVIENFLKGDVK